ncbi:MAG: hypothetical protein ACRCWD_03030 [Culicoidibacterales bacterium]
MKNQKQTWLLVGLFLLTSTLSIVSYLILTQFVAFLLQVAALIQQGSGVTATDVFTATWQTFGVKILLPLFTLGAWYMLAEFFTNTNKAAMKQRAFILSGATIVFMAIMLGLTWETFADFPMIAVISVPAIIVAIFASLKEVSTPEEKGSATVATVTTETAVETDTTVGETVLPVASRQGRKRNKKTQTHYRRYL